LLRKAMTATLQTEKTLSGNSFSLAFSPPYFLIVDICFYFIVKGIPITLTIKKIMSMIILWLPIRLVLECN
jgi:hypothetical protein